MNVNEVIANRAIEILGGKKGTKKPVSLENIKKNPNISKLPLIRQSRLSVMPIDTKSWQIILKMSNIN